MKMKMYNGDKIIPGLIAFLVIMTFPVWYNMGKAAPTPQIKIDTPVIQQMGDKKCVLPKADMRTEHMQMLNDWRTWVVRDNQRLYTAVDGKTYNMSLQNECMRCHSNKADFCDQCHNYTAVVPYCWTCHIEPKAKEAK
jgi:hypothetical protein